ncbi:MAG: AAA family ATPase, partial [Clostridia bacterium]|nr:AAA family ATPase [Clostridia bacterium]
RKLLNIDLDIIKKVYDYTPDLIREVVDDEILVSVSVNYYIEQAIAYKCLYINENHENNTEFDVDRAIQAYERRHNFFLDDGQIDAVKSIFNSGVSVITGGPGTGKTTIIKVIVDIFMGRNKRFELCAPTGRASKRMTQATGIESKTIHRLIGYSSENHQNMYNENNQLNTDVVIIDEISMCDIYIFYALLKALPPKCRLILVGDKDQLPSVSCGNILSDIIRSGVINVVSLKMVHRQDETSSIVTNAHRINEGEMPISKGVNDFFIDQKVEVNDILNAVSTMVKYRIPSYLNINQSDIQVIAPMRNGECGVNMLNALLQKELNPSTNTYMVEDTKFKLGDRVMHIKNNYDLTWVDARTGLTGAGVFNGDLGYVEQVRNNGLVVRFEDDRIVNYEKEDLKQLALAYCISVHKSQGSEFPVVILVLSRYSPMLVTRNLIYTAVTRAKRMVVIVGSKEILKRGVENNYTAKRYTLLKHFLEVTGTSDGTNKSSKAYDEAVFLIPDNINLSYDDIFNDDKK